MLSVHSPYHVNRTDPRSCPYEAYPRSWVKLSTILVYFLEDALLL